MKILTATLFLLLSLSLMLASHAKSDEKPQADDLELTLQQFFNGASIVLSNYNQDLVQVTVDSNNFFASSDGRYLFAGSVFDTKREVDIAAERDAKSRLAIIENQDSGLFVSYPSAKQRHQVTIFTDIDCPYCRKLHTNMTELNAKGVSVRYVMIPRQGVGSKSYTKTLNALCSSDAADSITKAMRGEPFRSTPCDSMQLANQIKLAQRLKINSTPTLVMPNGELQVGLRSPAELIQLLEKQSRPSASDVKI